MIKVGDRLPDSTFMTMGADGAPKPAKTNEVFAGKRVALILSGGNIDRPLYASVLTGE